MLFDTITSTLEPPFYWMLIRTPRTEAYSYFLCAVIFYDPSKAAYGMIPVLTPNLDSITHAWVLAQYVALQYTTLPAELAPQLDTAIQETRMTHEIVTGSFGALSVEFTHSDGEYYFILGNVSASVNVKLRLTYEETKDFFEAMNQINTLVTLTPPA